MPDPVPPSPPPSASPSERDPRVLRRRIGAWVKARRLELGLSQGAMIRELGYVSRNSVSNIETGREGLPAKRVYDWADLLRVPHEAFFRFVMGETLTLETSSEIDPESRLSSAEAELVASYRKLPAAGQRRVRELVRDIFKKT